MARYFREEFFSGHPRYEPNGTSLVDPANAVEITAVGNPRLDQNYTSEGVPEGLELNEFPEASMLINKGLEIPLIDAADYEHGPAGNASTDQTVLESSRLMQELARQGRRHESRDAVLEQMRTPQMFVNRPPEVVDLQSDPSMRYAVPTLLGLAINQFGPTLRADESLSKHSSRIVQRLVGSGIGQTHPQNPDAEANNSFDFSSQVRLHYIDPDTNEPILYGHNIGRGPGTGYPSERELAEARRTIKGIIRPKTRSAQFDALEKWESDRDKPYNPETDSNSMRIQGM